MIKCRDCRNYMYPVKLCTLGLKPREYYDETLLRYGVKEDKPTLECKEYTEEKVTFAPFLDILKTIGRDESFNSIPRWVRNFLSKDYFICSLEGWVFFHYPHHIKDIRKYKEVIFKCKDIYVYKITTIYWDIKDEPIEILGVTNINSYIPNLVSNNTYRSKAV